MESLFSGDVRATAPLEDVRKIIFFSGTKQLFSLKVRPAILHLGENFKQACRAWSPEDVFEEA